MNVPTKLIAFAVGLIVLFGAGFAVGSAFGPEPAEPTSHSDHQSSADEFTLPAHPASR